MMELHGHFSNEDHHLGALTNISKITTRASHLPRSRIGLYHKLVERITNRSIQNCTIKMIVSHTSLERTKGSSYDLSTGELWYIYIYMNYDIYIYIYKPRVIFMYVAVRCGESNVPILLCRVTGRALNVFSKNTNDDEAKTVEYVLRREYGKLGSMK